MTSIARALAFTVVVSVLAAGVGSWVGARWSLAYQVREPELHVILHHKLHLTTGQESRISDLEAGFAPRQQAFDRAMRAANQDLAAALTREHVYGPDAEMAVQHFHEAMQCLQEATIKHVLSMRAVLTSDQAKIFDRTIDQALTAPGS